MVIFEGRIGLLPFTYFFMKNEDWFCRVSLCFVFVLAGMLTWKIRQEEIKIQKLWEQVSEIQKLTGIAK